MKASNNILTWLNFTVLVLIWGSSFILIKNGLKGYSIWQAATIRLVSALFILSFMAVRHLRKVPKNSIPTILLVGLLNMFFPAYLFCAAQSNISSGMAGILNSLTPMFTSVIAIMFFGKLISKIQWLGLALGFCSTVFLILMNSSATISLNQYALLIILATICYGASINLIKVRLANVNSLHIATIAVSFAGLLALVFLVLSGYRPYVTHVTTKPFLSLVVLGVLGTALAQLLVNQLIKRSSAVFASSITYVIPIVAVLWGVLDGERLFYYHYLGMFGILTGIVIINRGKR